LKATGKRTVKVGIFGDAAEEAHEGTPLSNVEIASVHEFGAGNVPQRSFIRSTVDKQERQVRDVQRRIGRGIVRGTLNEEKGLGLLGTFLVAEIQKSIQAGIPPELEAATSARKGSSTPLIDTGQLIQSIAWEVENR
jgi:phage gpG-like protein